MDTSLKVIHHDDDFDLDSIVEHEFVTKWSSKLFHRLGHMDRHGDSDGPFALISWCATPVCSFHPTATAAELVKTRIDNTGCGGQCIRDHQIVELCCEVPYGGR